jgi:hypothetical protein
MNEKAKKLPKMEIDALEWVDSAGVANMSLAQEGAYFHLLALMWVRAGGIPDDPAWICRALRCTPATWRKLRSYLVDERKYFSASNGMLTNRRVSEKLARYAAYSAQQSANVRKRYQKPPPPAVPPVFAAVSHSPVFGDDEIAALQAEMKNISVAQHVAELEQWIVRHNPKIDKKAFLLKKLREKNAAAPVVRMPPPPSQIPAEPLKKMLTEEEKARRAAVLAAHGELSS